MPVAKAHKNNFTNVVADDGDDDWDQVDSGNNQPANNSNLGFFNKAPAA